MDKSANSQLGSETEPHHIESPMRGSRLVIRAIPLIQCYEV